MKLWSMNTSARLSITWWEMVYLPQVMELALMSEVKGFCVIDTYVHFFFTLGHSNALDQVHIAPLWPSATNHEREKQSGYDQKSESWIWDFHALPYFSKMWWNGNCSHSHVASLGTKGFTVLWRWLKYRITLSLLLSMITCLQGAHSTCGHLAGPTCVDANPCPCYLWSLGIILIAGLH